MISHFNAFIDIWNPTRHYQFLNERNPFSTTVVNGNI